MRRTGVVDAADGFAIGDHACWILGDEPFDPAAAAFFGDVRLDSDGRALAGCGGEWLRRCCQPVRIETLDPAS